jgi:hypothetical protein
VVLPQPEVAQPVPVPVRARAPGQEGR